MKIITNIRNKLNEREDELLSELELIFSKLCPSEKKIIDYEKEPKKIKEILERKKDINQKLKDSFLLNSFINDCINIENELKKISELNDIINNYNINSELKIFFYPEENEINLIYDNIKSFGKIYQQENDKKNFYIIKSEKEKNEYQIKINELKNDLDKLKKQEKQKEEELDKLKSNLNNIKKDLNEEIDKNKNLKNKIKNSKIHFTIRSRCASNKCLDSKDLNYNNSPHLWDYEHNNKNQIFELEKNNDGTYSIKNSSSGLYLGMDNNDGIAFKHKNENRQSFYLHHLEDGYYLFQEKGGKVIDLYGPNTQNGTNIGMWDRHNADNQQWKLVIEL